MAEATGLRNNALPYPIYGVPFGITFPLLDADGDPISPSSPDSERSLNGDTFADCTNEATEIATSSGICYLLLTAAEMTADVVTVRIQSTGAKTTVVTLYPRKLVSIRAGTSASGGVSTSTIVLDGSASAINDFYNGMVCVATIDSNVEARVISDYTGSSQTATVVPDWNVAPDNNDTFTIYLPEGVQINQANTTLVEGVDATDQIRDSVVDDATRIDASALNTASVTTVPAINAKTTNLPADPADASDVAAAIAALNDLSAAEVNAEVVDALATDTYTEITGVPAFTVPLTTMIRRMYAMAINGVTVTSTKKQFLNAAGAAQFEKDLSDDGTTYAETNGNAP